MWFLLLYFKFYSSIFFLETPLIQEVRLNPEYLLRSEPHTLNSLNSNDSIYNGLMEMFPNRSETIQRVLIEHSNERDMNLLASLILAEQ